jgi:type II secretion system protein N
MTAPNPLVASLRRGPLRSVGIAALAVFLTLVFVILRLPYEALERSLVVQAEERAGVRLQIASLSPGFSLRGPTVEAKDVQAVLADGTRLAVTALVVRPAWSLRWFLGQPALHLDIDIGSAGKITGVLALGKDRAWDGEFHELDLSILPLERLASGLSLAGRVDLKADVVLPRSGDAQGELSFQARDGTVIAPGLPVALPFQKLEGVLSLGGDVFANVSTLSFKSAQLTADLSGTIASASDPGSQALDMDLKLSVLGNSLKPFLRQLGVELARDGTAELKLTGTISRPTFR